MTVKSECFTKGNSLLRFYQYLDEIFSELHTVPTALRPNAVVGAIKQIDIDLAKGEVESLLRTGAVDEKTYHNFKAKLEGIEETLPSYIEPGLRESQIEDKLEHSSKELDNLKFDVENTLFQEVARCECGKKE